MRGLLPFFAALLAVAASSPALAQLAPGYTYSEVRTGSSSDALIFGFAAYKICQIKTFLFMAVYVLGAIAFVIFAIGALFTKFEMKQFIPILGALFIVGTADLLVSFFSPAAFYCPTVFSQL